MNTTTIPESSNAAVERIIHGAATDGEIDLSIGEPDLRAPQVLIDAAIESLKNGQTGYTAKPGIPELRSLLQDDIESSTGVRPDFEDVTVTVGGSEAVALAIVACSTPADGVIIPDPAWPNYVLLAEQHNIPVYRYAQGLSGDDFFDEERIRAGAAAGAKIVVINSPSNPAASVASSSALRRLAAIAEQYDLWILSDEAYESICFSGHRAPSIYSFAPDRTFVARTFSKTYSMTGFRVGALISPSSTRTTIGALHGIVTGCAATASQRAAITALKTLPQRGAELTDEFRRRFELAYEMLAPWIHRQDISSLGGFYLWLDFRESGLTSDFVCEQLRSRGVLVSNGLVYTQTDGFIRISLTTDIETLTAVFGKVRAVLSGK